MPVCVGVGVGVNVIVEESALVTVKPDNEGEVVSDDD